MSVTQAVLDLVDRTINTAIKSRELNVVGLGKLLETSGILTAGQGSSLSPKDLQMQNEVLGMYRGIKECIERGEQHRGMNQWGFLNALMEIRKRYAGQALTPRLSQSDIPAYLPT